MYDKPYNAEQIKKVYGEATYNKIKNDPIKKWRMETGIELVHKDDSLEELNKIWDNWKQMPSALKDLSDKKSMELFGVKNEEHYKQLKKIYEDYLVEDTRNQLISKSRNVDTYKHNVRGKNRFERKKYSKVASQVKSYNTIDMNKFFKQDLLEVNIPVTGETDNYEVTLKFDGVVDEIKKNIKSNQNKFEYRTVIQALTKVFNVSQVKVKCTCADFKYRYAHNLILNQNSVDGTDKDPGAGSTGMTALMKGQGCKHILLVLANQDWIMKVASCIKNYITYMDENKHTLFMKAIFPKLYDFTPEVAIEKNIVPEDTNFDTDKNIITTINDWAKNRGKIQKGSNKNPVAQANKDKEVKANKKEIKEEPKKEENKEEEKQ